MLTVYCFWVSLGENSHLLRNQNLDPSFLVYVSSIHGQFQLAQFFGRLSQRRNTCVGSVKLFLEEFGSFRFLDPSIEASRPTQKLRLLCNCLFWHKGRDGNGIIIFFNFILVWISCEIRKKTCHTRCRFLISDFAFLEVCMDLCSESNSTFTLLPWKCLQGEQFMPLWHFFSLLSLSAYLHRGTLSCVPLLEEPSLWSASVWVDPV